MIFFKRRNFLTSMVIGVGVSVVLPSVYAAEAGVTDEIWTDTQRQRSLPVKVRVPAMQAGPWPVVIFSHGLGGSREGGARWGEAWAEAGYLVLHLQHPGSDTGALRNARQSATPEQLVARLQDVTFALDEMQRRYAAKQGPWANADLSRIGLSGHSFGAKTTLGIAGEKYPGTADDRYPALNIAQENRIKAFIAFSPSSPARDANLQQRFANLRSPMLHVTGTRDGSVLGNADTPEDRTKPFEYAASKGHYLWVLKDADHMTFGGDTPNRMLERMLKRSDEAKRAQPKQEKQIAAVTTQFWNAMLKNDAAALKQLAKPDALLQDDVWRVK